MIDKIKYIARLSASALFSFVKILLLASFNGAAAFTLGLIFLLKDSGSPGAAHAGAEAGLLTIIVTRPTGSVLLALIVVLMYVSIFFGYRYVVKKIISRLVKDSSEKYLYPLLDKAIDKCRQRQPAQLKTGADFAVAKLQIIKNLKEESENKWLKRGVSYGLKKIKLDDVTLTEGEDIYTIIRQKAITALHETTTPSRRNILIALALQWILAIASLVF